MLIWIVIYSKELNVNININVNVTTRNTTALPGQPQTSKSTLPDTIFNSTCVENDEWGPPKGLSLTKLLYASPYCLRVRGKEHIGAFALSGRNPTKKMRSPSLKHVYPTLRRVIERETKPLGILEHSDLAQTQSPATFMPMTNPYADLWLSRRRILKVLCFHQWFRQRCYKNGRGVFGVVWTSMRRGEFSAI